MSSPPGEAAGEACPDLRPTFVVYGAGTNQVPVLEACQRLGWRVVAIDREVGAPGASIADRFVCSSLGDHEAIERALETEALCGVAARVTDRQALESARLLSASRGLASPCAGLLSASTSKVALAEACRRAGLRTPRRYATADSVEFGRVSLILRPDVTLRGKAGIHRVQTSDDFDRLCPRTAEQSGNQSVDISEWIEGIDVSVLAHLDGGTARRLALWDEWVGIDPEGRIRGLGAGFPSLFEGREAPIDRLLDRLAAAFPESRSLITLSLRIDPSGTPWIIEIHLGVGGDGLADQLIPAALPELDVFGTLVSVSAGRAHAIETAAPRARGLLESTAGWVLIEAPDAETLRARARSAVPEGWEAPCGLRPGASARSATQKL